MSVSGPTSVWRNCTREGWAEERAEEVLVLNELEIAMALTHRPTAHFIGPLPSVKFVLLDLPVFEVKP